MTTGHDQRPLAQRRATRHRGAPGVALVATALILLTAITAFSAPVAAQVAAPAENAIAAAAAAAPDTDPAPLASASAASPLADVGRLGAEEQVTWLQQAARAGVLEKLDDAQLIGLFRSFKPETIPLYVGAGRAQYSDYEFTLLRQERLAGKWQAKPDHMLVRYQHEPLRIYAKWLPDSAHAGQEIIYDQTRRRDEMYGHLGGLFNIMPIWTAIDGSLARSQSNHSVRELGLRFIVDRYLQEARKFGTASVLKPTEIAVQTEDGVRVVVMTWDAPGAQPDYYAKRSKLGLDLRHPWFDTVESFDNDGQRFEKLVFDKISPRHFDDMTFDPKNAAYKF
jgi:hypothetical protein